MDQNLQGRRIAFLVVDNFEQAELTGPKEGLENAGAKVIIASAKTGEVVAMKHDEKADSFQVDMTFDDLNASTFDAVVLPGGVFNADQIRSLPGAQKFVREMDEAKKPIAVICHGAWLLISSGLIAGRTLTSWPSLQDDIRNAGGAWVDREVVVDGNLISSRKPDDIPAFNKKLIEALAAVHAASHA